MRAWEANIRKVVPYVPGDQPKGGRLIKLNTNENPYPPAPGVQTALREMDYDRFRKYPDPAAAELVHTLAEYYRVGDDQVFVGVGSDDVIAMAFLTFFNGVKPIRFPDPPILSIKYGRICFGFLTRRRSWMGNFASCRRIIMGKTAALFFPIPMRRRGF